LGKKAYVLFISHISECSSIQVPFLSSLELIPPSVLGRKTNPQYQDQNNFCQVREYHGCDPKLVGWCLVCFVKEGTGDVGCAVTKEEDGVGEDFLCVPFRGGVS
jgi:hypothetical protein